MEQQANRYTNKQIMRFLVPSVIGALLFLFPVPTESGLNLAIAVIFTYISTWLAPVLPSMVYIIIFISAIGTLLAKIAKPKFIMQNDWLKGLFDVPLVWAVIRVLGAVIAFMVLFQVGHESMISTDTGLYVVSGLLVSCLVTFLIGGTLMDLLMNYGLMEFVGTFMTKIMRPLYKVPGRCAIDCLASWIGDAVIGILITTNQYQLGYYSKREASIIATTFSAVSISFSLVVADQVGLTHMFLPFFAVTMATGFIVGAIMCRIPPLSRMSDTYHVGEGVKEDIIPGTKLYDVALSKAVARGQSEPLSVAHFIKKGAKVFVECAIPCMPVVMFVATVSLAVSYYTNFFSIIGTPFIPLLELLNIPEAAAASACMLAGFGDMFIPAVLASSSVVSEYTRFFIGVLSITQLIYMSEVGGMLLGSKLPLKFTDLILIFLIRTIVCTPVIILLMNLFVF